MFAAKADAGECIQTVEEQPSLCSACLVSEEASDLFSLGFFPFFFSLFLFYNSPPKSYYLLLENYEKRDKVENGGGGIQLRYRRRDIGPITIGNPTQRKVIQSEISKSQRCSSHQ